MWLLWGTETTSSLVSLGSDVGRGSVWSLEVASKEGIDGSPEEDLGTAELWESEPQDKGELEEVIEWEPIGKVESTLKDAQEGKGHPVRQPLCVISFSDSK